MSVLDLEILTELKELMEDDFDVLIETYIQDSRVRLDELKAQIESNDMDAIRNTAHSLKGSSSNVGAIHLSGLCQHMESNAKANTLADPESALAEIIESHQVTVTELEQMLA